MSDSHAIVVERSRVFVEWLDGLRDQRAAARITTRLRRLAFGHWGDAKSVGDGVTELRVDYGRGYRVYLTKRGEAWVVLLCGGDKGSQARDISRAKTMARTINP